MSAYFYIPEFDEPPSNLSGMVISLFGEHPEPTSVLSYFSKEEDIGKIHDLLKTTIKWEKVIHLLLAIGIFQVFYNCVKNMEKSYIIKISKGIHIRFTNKVQINGSTC